MPVLQIHTNITIEHKDEFLNQTSNLIAQALGKPESYVMILLSDDKPMSFAGEQEPTAFLDLKSLGLDSSQTQDLSNTLCSYLEDKLHIPSHRIYIEFTSPERAMFGWDKSTF